MKNRLRIEVPTGRITDFCHRHAVRKLSFFGSVLRDDFKPSSDVDVLIEFESGRNPGFFGLAGMEVELAEILQRKVDLRTPAELSRYFRDKVVASAEVQYAGK